MVGFLELVLDDDRRPVRILGHEVDREGAGPLLALDGRQGCPDLLGDDIDVLLEPAGEVEGLVLPDLAEGDALYLADHPVTHSQTKGLSDEEKGLPD